MAGDDLGDFIDETPLPGRLRVRRRLGGRVGVGRPWRALAWLAWPGLAWPGLAWPGLALSFPNLTLTLTLPLTLTQGSPGAHMTMSSSSSSVLRRLDYRACGRNRT